MKIKVCGMRDKQNVLELLTLKPDFVGFIFYTKSERFVAKFPIINFPEETKKVGVFVNESKSEVLKKVKNYTLNCVQLHGNETKEYCEKLQLEAHKLNLKFEIIKAFAVNDNFDFEQIKPYETCCNYFLFDTKGVNYGGNGIKFNWEILQKYTAETPFLLSGGITKNDAKNIKKIKHKAFIGIDINSGFESKPALKNCNDIKEFKHNLL